jgi:two-component system chemotaxis response regulator CheY
MSALPNGTVLIVDDDPFIRKLIATTLEDVSGLDLVEAADGVEAVELAGRQAPVIVFLDLNMPRLDGIGAAAQMRALPGSEITTIVMLTAAGQEREREAREAGADLFLTKPFSPLDLLRLVDEIGTRR